MLSVVVVGRNDNHGYNLGKRVASSLNSISMRLRDGDELIFVDWNTPRPFPPMPVSIIDDLTDQTMKYLRILVVDPKIHDVVKGASSKMILEPIARNVGIRRANPRNKWILSTNTDILFIGQEDFSFQDLIAKLDNRLWQSFRYEIPEYIWEVLDKRNPHVSNNIIQTLSETTPIKFNLTTSPVENNPDNLLFADAIGDFQLATREMWDLIRGFPEEMLNGWHVDSRAAVQMIRKSGQESRILPADCGLSTFHQNHLRSLTHFHSNETMNSGDLIENSYENGETWGLSHVDIYEYHFQDYRKNISKLKLSFTNETSQGHLQISNKGNFYSIDRTALFLLDELISLKPKNHITIVSTNERLIEKVSSLMDYLQVTVEVSRSGQELQKIHSPLIKSDLVIIDFGIDEISSYQLSILNAGSIALELSSFSELILPNTRVVLVRAQNWAIRTLAKKYFAVPLFNNYSAVLTGVKKSNPDKLSFFQKTILLNGIRVDYNLPKNLSFLWNFIFRTFKKFLPRKVLSIVRRILIK